MAFLEGHAYSWAAPWWEPVPLRTLSLLVLLVSQGVTFCLRANAEGRRANLWWWLLWDDTELPIKRLFPWAVRESRSLRMPAFHVLLLRCICDCFARNLNMNIYFSKTGTEAHFMLAEHIFRGHADISNAVETEMLQTQCAAGSSNMQEVDRSSKFEGPNAPSHVSDVGLQRNEDTEMKGILFKKASDQCPGDKGSNMKRTSELAECLRILEMAKVFTKK